MFNVTCTSTVRVLVLTYYKYEQNLDDDAWADLETYITESRILVMNSRHG